MQLDRALYQATAKIIENAGGKWNRNARRHLFRSDPLALLGMIESGKTESQQQKFQAFFTPNELAMKVAKMADVKGKDILEPSAGDGALADACRELGAKSVCCVEINPECARGLDERFVTTEMDFLKLVPIPEWPFDRVVMNPPFTKGQDIKHVNHALQFLKPGGKLVAIMAGNDKSKWFDSLEWCYEIEDVPAGAFKESGTNVTTIIVTIHT
jgi:predicted RNA methylase